MPTLIPTTVTDPPPRPTVFVAVDPGVSGGVAVLASGGSVLLAAATPATSGLQWRLFQSVAEIPGVKIAVVELVTGFVGGYNRKDDDGRQTNPGARSFVLGESYGAAKAYLAAVGIPMVELVPPRRWQAAVGLVKPPSTDGPRWKRMLKTRAIELFPGTTVTLKTSDALLMAYYCREKYGAP